MIDIIIPSAGQGLKIRGVYSPKALIKINKETIIERQIRILSNLYPNSRFIIPVGFEKAKIKSSINKKENIKYVINNEYENTTVVKSIELAFKKTRDRFPILIIFGDLVFSDKFILNIPLNNTSVLIDSNENKRNRIGLNFKQEDSKVLNFSYGLTMNWSQILLISSKDKEYFYKLISGPLSHKFLLHEILNKFILSSSIKIFNNDNNDIIEVNSLKDISNARKII